jgi:hypothetical protein
MENNNFNLWLEQKDPALAYPLLNESASRYSVEVNYRTTMEEMIDQAAKLVLGYISAALKDCDFHIKTIYDAKPYRIIISTRNWDDGEWVGVVLWKDEKFIIAKGHYNKDKKTVSLMGSHKSQHTSAAELSREMRNYMEKLKHEKPRGSDTLEPAPMKRGPKPKFMQKINKVQGPWKPYKPY